MGASTIDDQGPKGYDSGFMIIDSRSRVMQYPGRRGKVPRVKGFEMRD
jgi:hypothetical protein